MTEASTDESLALVMHHPRYCNFGWLWRESHADPQYAGYRDSHRDGCFCHSNGSGSYGYAYSNGYADAYCHVNTFTQSYQHAIAYVHLDADEYSNADAY